MKVHEKYRKTLVVTSAAILLLIVASTNRWAVSANFTIISPDNAQAQTGKTYGEWSAALWKHLFEIPAENSPGLDPTGVNCNFGQTGSVFFLASTFGGSATRNQCRVPSGKALFLPILTFASTRNVDAKNKEPEHSIRNYLNGYISSTQNLQVNIDGIDISTLVSLEPRVTPLRAVSTNGFFTVIAPINNIFGGIPGQSYDTVSDGFYLMVAPLSPGPHTIKFGGVGRNFAADVTYNLYVEP